MAHKTAIGPDAVGDLGSQFPRGNQNQGAAAFCGWGRTVPGDPVKKRQDKCGRFAGSCLGRAENILSALNGGNGLNLNRCWYRIAFGGDSAKESPGKPEIFEFWQ